MDPRANEGPADKAGCLSRGWRAGCVLPSCWGAAP